MVLLEHHTRLLRSILQKEARFLYRKKHQFMTVWTGISSRGQHPGVNILPNRGITTGTGMAGRMVQLSQGITVPTSWMWQGGRCR